VKKVYIILVNYNGWKDTVECIKSVIKNTYENFQIIVVDNNSTDNSVDKISDRIRVDFKNKIQFFNYKQDETDNLIIRKIKKIKNPEKTVQPVIFIQSAVNNGFAAGNNIALKYGLAVKDADYFWLLNNDTEIERNSLKEMVTLAETNKDIGIAGSKLLFSFDHNIIQSVGNDHVSWKGIGHGSFDGISNKDNIPDYIEMKSVMGASLLIKAEVVKKIGLMEEQYFMQAEETDWCVKAAKAGYRIVTNTKSVIIHKDGESTGRKRIEKYLLGRRFFRTNIKDFLMWGYYSFRNEIYFVKKNFESQYIRYCLIYLPLKYVIKLIMIFIFNDDYKLKRIYLLNKAVADGIKGKMGKTIDPGEWKRRFL
jgi:GT2 family glycosyltransferase